MKKVEVKCEDCGKEIMADVRSNCVTHNRCVVHINEYLYRKDFERLLNNTKKVEQ